MRSTHVRSLFFVLSTALSIGTAKASSLSVFDWDTRAGGSYSVVANNSADGNGSLHLTTTPNFQIGGVNQDKVAVIFANGGALGTLNALTDVSLQAFKSSTPSTIPAADFAYRLQLANGDSLVYENAYNGSAAVPLDIWRNLDLTAGNFWLYDKATDTNFNAAGQEHALSFYLPTEGTQSVVGLQVAYGSGIGAFDGNVDNIHLAFGAQTFDGAVVAAPLPSSAFGGLALFGALAVWSVKSRKAKITA